MKDGVMTGLLNIYVDFTALKTLFGDIIRVDSVPQYIPHLVESQQVIERKKRGSRGNPNVELIGETTRHTILYGDTDSICIGFQNICTAFGIQEGDDILKVSRFIEWFCLNVLHPFYYKVIQNLCDRRNVTNMYILECEQILEKMHLYAKKCYCSSLIILNKKDVSEIGDVKAGGIVIKKSSYPKIIRDSLKKMLNTMLRGVYKDKNNLPYLLEMMGEHIDKFRKMPVEDLCNTQTVRKFSDYTVFENGRYRIKDGAGVNEKGMTTYNNLVIEKGLNIPLLENGAKVKTFPIVVGNEIGYFSWDIDYSESPPEWSPEPSMDILILKKYTVNAIIYLTAEYPELIGKEDYLVDPKNFPMGLLQ